MEIRKLTEQERDALIASAFERDPFRVALAEAQPGDVFRVELAEGDRRERIVDRLRKVAARVGYRLTWLRDVGDATTRYFQVCEREGEQLSALPAAPEPTAPAPEPTPEPTAAPVVMAPTENPLSPGELQVLTLLAADLDYKTIAKRMGLSERTPAVYASQARRKLGVDSLPEAIALARARGWLDGAGERGGEELPPLRRQYLEWAKARSEEAS